MENRLREGSATFAIYDKNLHHRSDDPFILWLKDEGFEVQSFGHNNSDNFLYVNVNAKVYNWGMAGVALSPVLFNHAIHIEEFKKIYSIFKQYEGLDIGIYSKEDQKKHDEELLLMEKKARLAEEARIEYFKSNPSYEKWCEDITNLIINDPSFSKYYDKKRVTSEMDYYSRILHLYYEEKESPKAIAGQWDIITL